MSSKLDIGKSAMREDECIGSRKRRKKGRKEHKEALVRVRRGYEEEAEETGKQEEAGVLSERVERGRGKGEGGGRHRKRGKRRAGEGKASGKVKMEGQSSGRAIRRRWRMRR